MRLYVNIDHVATIRQARRTDEPDPVRAAILCELAGADGITFHLREDRRHIQDRDVRLLAQLARTVLNFELAAAPDVVAVAVETRPHQATLVPERREEVTTEGGLDLAGGGSRLAAAIARLGDAGIRVSLFIDPTRDAVQRARDLGVPAIELHTGVYARAGRDASEPLRALAAAARFARSLDLAVHAGHGLTYENVAAVAATAEIEELNIGHSIVARAVCTGLVEAVRTMRQAIDRARRDAR